MPKKLFLPRGAGCGVVTALLAALLSAAIPAQAGTGSLGVSAVVVSRSTCGFFTGARTLAFGSIDPNSATSATGSVTVQFFCIGAAGSTTYSLWAGDGSNAAGAGLRQMRHATVTTEFLPYSLSITPSSANIPRFAIQTVTVSGTVAPADFRNARVGNFSDTVVLTLDP